MIPLHIYESRTAPPERRFIAQYVNPSSNLYMTIHGPSEAVAVAKAELMQEFHAVHPMQRKAFDLKARLAAIGGGDDDFGDML